MRKKALAVLLTITMLAGTIAGMTPGSVVRAQSDDTTTQTVEGTSSSETSQVDNSAGGDTAGDDITGDGTGVNGADGLSSDGAATSGDGAEQGAAGGNEQGTGDDANTGGGTAGTSGAADSSADSGTSNYPNGASSGTVSDGSTNGTDNQAGATGGTQADDAAQQTSADDGASLDPQTEDEETGTDTIEADDEAPIEWDTLANKQKYFLIQLLEEEELEWDDLSNEEKLALLDLIDQMQTLDDVLSMNNYSFEWINGTSKFTITKDAGGKKTGLDMTPSLNGTNTATAKIMMTIGGNESIEKGQAEIRIPRYAITNRDGKGSAEPRLSILKAPETGGVTSFHYYIDEATDEIVIVNYDRLPPGGYYFDCTVEWDYSPMEVEDGFKSEDLSASFSVTGSNGTSKENTTQDHPLKATVHTGPVISTTTKKETDKKESWQAEWGPKPADADDYFYVVWQLYCSMSYSSTTSAYTLYFEDVPSDYVDGAEVVAWSGTYYNSSEAAAKTFKQGDAEAMKNDPVKQVNTRTELERSTNYMTYRNVVVRYPKEMTTEIGPDGTKINLAPRINNSFTARAVNPEDREVKKSGNAYYIYQHVNQDVPYPGDVISSYKRAHYGWLASGATTDYSSYKVALNILRNGTPVIGSWSIDVSQKAYMKTSNDSGTTYGQKPYQTVLRDGMLYIAGERLQPGDYEFVKFYPTQFDVNVPDYNDDTGWSLVNSTNYAADYAPIKVYYRKALTGTWTEYGEVKKTSASTYTWTPVGGTSAVINSSDGVALPEGAVDVKFVHEDAKYGVEYRMDLYHRLKTTDHVLNLIGKDATQAGLINMSEAYGEQDDKIFTAGTFLNDSSTTGIKTDVENSDHTDYGAMGNAPGAGPIHCVSDHVLKAEKGTASFTKSMGTPVNDTKAAKVTIPVTLKWDYYLNFKSMNITIQEAAAANIIRDAREAVFYDLLPKGCTIDVNTIKAVPYSVTNLNDQRCNSCDYTVEMVNNWKGSGRTMAIIRVAVPDNFVNFAKSNTYLDTGFVLTFKMIDTWDNIAVNGTTLNNQAAIVCQEGSVPNGRPDDGQGSAEQDLMKNLYTPEGGDYADNDNNVRYANAKKVLNVTTATQTSFSKYVKGAADPAYSEHTVIPATGDYSYELRYGITNGSNVNDVVLFDILETAYLRDDGPNNAFWKGTFKGVNIDSIKRNFPDCNPKIYYSTSTDFTGITEERLTGDWQDLTKTTRWTLSTDYTGALSDVTAVAIDLGSKQFKGPLTLKAEIFMTSPGDYENYVAKPGKAAVLAQNKAYNKSSKEPNTEPCKAVTVEITDPKVSLNKTSTPASGSQTVPRQVAVDDEIEYVLDASNKNVAEAISNVKIVDTLPKEVQVDVNQLKFYFGGALSNKKTVGAGERVQAEIAVDAATGAQTVTFTVDKLAGNETVHLVIPAKVMPAARKGVVLENQAKMTEFNGKKNWEITSQKTYHKTEPEYINIPVKKVWEDNNNQYNARQSVVVQLYQDGVKMTGKSATLTAPNWTATFSNLVKYREDGVTLYDYTVVEETELPGFTTTYSTSADGNTRLVTNTIRVINPQGTGTIKLNKFRLGTTTSVPGVTYKVVARGDGETGTAVATGTTGPDGSVTLDIPIPGTFTDATTTYALDIYETAVPNDGYSKLAAPIQVTLKKGAKQQMYDATQKAYKDVYLWTVDDTAGVALATPDANGNTVAWDAVSKAIKVENKYTMTPTTLKIPVQKVIEGDYPQTTPASTPNFRFTLTKGTATPTTLTIPMPAATTAAGDAELSIQGEDVDAFGEFKFTEPGIYTYTVKENAAAVPGYTFDTKEHTVRVEVIDNASKLEATYTVDGAVVPVAEYDTKEVTVAKFTNKYKPAPVDLTFKVQKTIDGDQVPIGENNKTFTFTMVGIGGTPTPAGNVINVTFNNTGYVKEADFPKLTFTKAGTYKYAIMENGGNIPGYTFDGKEHQITVTVTDNNAQLEAVATHTKDGSAVTDNQVAFKNNYKPAPTLLSIPVKKTITGHDRPDGNTKNFTFELSRGANDAGVTTPLPEGTPTISNTATITINDEGTNLFKDIKFEKAGTYTYTVKEQKPASLADYVGYNFDTTIHTITVKVTDTKGVLSAKWESDQSGDMSGGTGRQVAFTNNYTPTPLGNVIIPFKKTVKPIVTLPGSYSQAFKFTITRQDTTAPIPTPSEKTLTATATDLTVSNTYSAMTYTKAGTYVYEIKESKIDPSDKNHVYDLSTHTVVVKVTDENGTLKAETSVDGKPHTVLDADGKTQEVHITNDYNPPPAKVSFDIRKVVDNHRREDMYKKEFVFTLNNVTADAPMPQNPRTSIVDSGTGKIGEIAIEGGKTFVYEISEQTGNEPGYEYDQSVYEVTVVTSYDLSNNIVANVTYKNKATGATLTEAVFTNTYTPDPVTYKLPVYKKITGVERPGNRNFTFNMEAVTTGAPMPASAKATVRGKDTDAEAKGTFGEIKFETAGTYEYKVTEASTPALPGYTYDPAVYTVQIKVEDKDGKLEVGEVKYKKEARPGTTATDETEALFVNEYKPEPLEWKMPVSKTIGGSNRKVEYYKDFTFTLDPTNGSPAPTGTGAPTQATITDEGDAEFGVIHFDEAGTYTYTVTETGGTEKGYSYDTDPRMVTVVVIDNNGKLAIDKISTRQRDPATGGMVDLDDSPVFNNKYTPDGGTYTLLAVQKSIIGPVKGDGKFTFVLDSPKGAPLPEGEENRKVTIDGEGVATFPKDIPLVKEGTFEYRITEVDDHATYPYYDFDKTVYYITVQVEDNDGELVVVKEKIEKKGKDDTVRQEVTGSVASFSNEYRPVETTFTLPVVTKKIEGEEKGNGTFTFKLASQTGAPLPAVCTTSITGEGTAIFPDVITLKSIGTYVYEITEVAGTDDYEYDKTLYVLTLEVTDENGYLKVAPTLEKQIDMLKEPASEMVFSNKYIPPAIGGGDGGGGDEEDGGGNDGGGGYSYGGGGDDGGGGTPPTVEKPKAEEEIPTFEAEDEIPDPSDPDAPPVIRLIRNNIEKLFYKTLLEDEYVYMAEDGEVLGRRRMRSPRTGDDAHPEVYGSLMVISLAGIAICLTRRRKLWK